MKPLKGVKQYEFSDLPTPDIELELLWSYYHDPGRYYGPPENCYPAETDMSVELVDGWEQIVMEQYIIHARKAIEEIQERVEGMNYTDQVEEWAAMECEF